MTIIRSGVGHREIQGDLKLKNQGMLGNQVKTLTQLSEDLDVIDYAEFSYDAGAPRIRPPSR